MTAEKIMTITAADYGKMVNAAAAKLTANAENINKLNVFPVPDGDTGTNMAMSMASGAQYERDAQEETVGALAKATAKGLLMGARGNSGVILSQIFRGMADSLADKDNLSARDLADALMMAAQVAYKSVMKPTEGTILTVIRESAAAADEAANAGADLLTMMDQVAHAAQVALDKTPDLLPVLKEVGVVDSGGQGLVLVLSAFAEVISGTVSEESLQTPDNAELDQMVSKLHAGAQANESLRPEDIKYGYCTEVMVEIGKGTTVEKPFDYQTFYDYIADKGDSLLVINDEDVVKVHVHTEDPGAIIHWGGEFGSLVKVKVDNMRDQQQAVIDEQEKEDQKNQQTAQEQKPAPDVAVFAVAAGDGVAQLFDSLGVYQVITGGQTMNPSTADFVEAIEKSQAKAAIILPNNSNIFLAADQAKDLVDVPVEVVKSRTIQQGLTAMLGYNPAASVTDNQEAMTEQLATVVSGQITHSVRDTTLNGQTIKKGDWLGMVDGEIVVVGQKLLETAKDTLAKMLDDDSEIVTIITGKDAKKKDIKALTEAVAELDEDLECEVHDGGQDLYPFLLSVE
ncbi:DAK2 domain-containing protein [Fructobacillus tropaeoli]|uniref:Predicted kinase related to dihydroxyacetone kinase (YloV) n=1 Tax=Fructobacillus tropaeoli TaxID=709323 RepID=A0ABM9MPF5_9LACO|nr:DAK2 domain-containing protein [Fructobacillus tropaeoli]GIC70063.1 DAK2 domain-containing protein [Fructobacillus tropaeoli]CAK1228926.1 Predicted kinase related to dihydroxyacetone kinase (YloV) [Fructobacillus tropaeoli]CAK1230265.1 Predicted kinase related to dihydroxyacetone kinase (YloV) [Fructobacillus tropaeoli]